MRSAAAIKLIILLLWQYSIDKLNAIDKKVNDDYLHGERPAATLLHWLKPVQKGINEYFCILQKRPNMRF